MAEDAGHAGLHEGVVSVDLRPATPEVEFPPFDAGSHIDLHLPNGLVRSYSLCNPSSDRQRYVVGVLNDKKSRGGSRYVHQQLRVGSTIQISHPRNNFKLEEGADRTVLVAGGMAAEDLEGVLAGLLHLVRHPQVQVQMAAASIVNNATEETGK